MKTLEEKKKAARCELEVCQDPVAKYGIAIFAFPPADFYTPPFSPTIHIDGDASEIARRYMSVATRVFLADEKKSLLLHTASLNSVFMVRVPAGTNAGTIDISKQASFGNTHGILLVERGALAHVVLDKHTAARSGAIECILEDGAALVFDVAQTVAGQSQQLFAASLGAHASLTVNERVSAHAFSKARSAVVLDGAASSVAYSHVYHITGDAVEDRMHSIYHKGEKTVSQLNVRGAAVDSAKVVWRGYVNVGKAARGASAYQRHRSLLASGTAEIDAAPLLEIFTDDISCKHSSSVERIKPEHLFYFQSRGISEEEARRQVINGFLI